MSRSAEWIASTYKARKNAQGEWRARAAEVSALYNGRIAIPLPEFDRNEQAAVANQLITGLEQEAMRVWASGPAVTCPPLQPGAARSETRARTRRLAIGSWWEQNGISLQGPKRARWLLAYGSSPVVIRPDAKRQIPRWELRDPLTCFPAPRGDSHELTPTDAIFALKRSWGWINDRWPDKAPILQGKNANPDEMFEVLEYCDADEHVMVALGKPEATNENPKPWDPKPTRRGVDFVELERFDNRLGVCPVVCPTRISLDNPVGKYDQMPALYRMQARAMALWLISGERSVFPDVWFVSRPTEIVQVIQEPDGRAGRPGLVKGGDVKDLTTGPPPQIAQMVDMLGDAQSFTAAVPSAFGGEAPSNARTARAAQQLVGNTVDFGVQESQKILAMSMQAENRLAIRTALVNFGAVPKSYYFELGGFKGHADYTPSRDFDSDANTVKWPLSGVDAEQAVIGIGQRLGLEEMSVETAQEIDPFIDDPEKERDRILAESLQKAMLAGINQQIVGGQLGPLEIARMYTEVKTNRASLFDAYEKVHEQLQQQAQAAQAATGPGGPGGVTGGAPGGPSTAAPGAPGLNAPAVAAQLGLGPGNLPGGQVSAPSPGVQHMAGLLSDLRPRKTA